ncbi:hypothetical protein AZF37_02950 [endosymbiont 'TC1' of Trimyema compressum]|uniref:hypothetical protein n=1 Tax=endosymbiont 'TC1' of Trimyema compressum TaxID=243899 RepID=UPI0007F08A31|nr:hypothetical protein [endosymbiont 'TC1' of Trimyema compressum]AMP20269.1 hypothetical protein AZF37_02950 [endosymbiont 'TC1' of Trimyema compressum]
MLLATFPLGVFANEAKEETVTLTEESINMEEKSTEKETTEVLETNNKEEFEEVKTITENQNANIEKVTIEAFQSIAPTSANATTPKHKLKMQLVILQLT